MFGSFLGPSRALCRSTPRASVKAAVEGRPHLTSERQAGVAAAEARDEDGAARPMAAALLPPRVLEELEAQRAASLWDETLTFLERGKREDTAGDHRAAAILIAEGLEGLHALAELSKREAVLAG